MEFWSFEAIFVIFSEAGDLFGIIFQIPGVFMKIGGLRVDTQEVQGPFCKVAWIKEFPDLIFNGKFHGPSSRCGGPRAAPVHGGPRILPRRRLAGERLKRRPRAWNLFDVEEKEEGMAMSLTGYKRGWRRDEHGRATVGNNRRRRHSVGWTL
jgi:hypothetical protein